MRSDLSEDEYLQDPAMRAISQGEIAARAWQKLMGQSPENFYDWVSPQGKVAIRKALEEEIGRQCALYPEATTKHISIDTANIRDESLLLRVSNETERPVDNTYTNKRWKVNEGSLLYTPEKANDSALLYTPDQLKDGALLHTPDKLNDGALLHTPDKLNDGALLHTPDKLNDGALLHTPEKAKDFELLQRAWDSATRYSIYRATWLLSPDAFSRDAMLLQQEAERIRDADKLLLPPDLKKHYLETNSEQLKAAYKNWVVERAIKLFDDQSFRFEDVDVSNRDGLINDWQREIGRLREEERQHDSWKKQELSGVKHSNEDVRGASYEATTPRVSDDFDFQKMLMREELDVNPVDDWSEFEVNELIFGDQELDEHEQSKQLVHETQLDAWREGAFTSGKEPGSTHGREAEIVNGSGAAFDVQGLGHDDIDDRNISNMRFEVIAEALKELRKGGPELQESVMKWWSRARNNDPFGTESPVIDYPRSPESFELDGKDDLHFDIESLAQSARDVMPGQMEGTRETVQESNRTLAVDGLCFDAVNRPREDGALELDEREQDLEFDRSSWNERGR